MPVFPVGLLNVTSQVLVSTKAKLTEMRFCASVRDMGSDGLVTPPLTLGWKVGSDAVPPTVSVLAGSSSYDVCPATPMISFGMPLLAASMSRAENSKEGKKTGASVAESRKVKLNVVVCWLRMLSLM